MTTENEKPTWEEISQEERVKYYAQAEYLIQNNYTQRNEDTIDLAKMIYEAKGRSWL